MSYAISSKSTALKFTSLLLLSQLITACDLELDTNLPGVPTEGRFTAVAANQHTGVTSVQLGAAIFIDGEPVNLYGGDVVQGSTANDFVLLLDNGFYTGSYSADLPNDSNLDQIDFLIVHKPEETREGRWYPIDLFNFDPGPGELVGASASVTLPPEPLNIASSNTNFVSINDSFTLTWTAESVQTPADIMKVRSLVSCTNGTKNNAYGTEVVLVDDSDDGTENININQFIYDITDESSTVKFILNEARAALQELLIKLSNGEITDDFFANNEIINPVDNECEIQLFLFRQRDGSFSTPSSPDSRIVGSRSSEITLLYNPN